MAKNNTENTQKASDDIISRYRPHEPTWLDKMLFGFFFHSKKTRPADPEKDRELIGIIIRLCDKKGIRVPKRIQVAETYIPNAAFYPITNSITISSDILDAMPKEQVEAVIGHELSHYKHRWRDLSVAIGLAIVGGHLFTKAHEYAVKKIPDSGKLAGFTRKTLQSGYLMYYPRLLSFFIPLNLYQRFVSEPEADKFAAELAGPKAMGDALTTLKTRSREVWEKKERGELPKTPVRDTVGRLLTPIPNHPPIDKRIAKMRAMEKNRLLYAKQLERKNLENNTHCSPLR